MGYLMSLHDFIWAASAFFFDQISWRCAHENLGPRFSHSAQLLTEIDKRYVREVSRMRSVQFR